MALDTKAPTNRTTNNGFRLALNSLGGQALALSSRTEQVVFPMGRMQIRPVKAHPEAARCW